LYEIEALGKPAQTPCPHQDETFDFGGCRIYGARPAGCRKFECGWLSGAFGDDDRPDWIDCIFEKTYLHGDDVGPDDPSAIVVWVGYVFNLSTDRASRAIAANEYARLAAYAEPGVVVVLVGDYPDVNRIYGWPRDVVAVGGFLEQLKRAGVAESADVDPAGRPRLRVSNTADSG